MPEASQQSLQANSLVKLNYTATGIVFAKANANNIAIANTESGIGTLTDVIAPVTLATGKITSNSSQTAITGVGTRFNIDFRAGQFLYYYNNEGEPAMLGKVASITSDVLLTLTANATITQTSVNCGMASTVLNRMDNIIVRIPVVANGVNVILPNWSAYRDVNAQTEVTAFNNSEFSNIEQYSLINAPQTPIGSLVNIPFTITPVYNFQSYDTLNSSGQKVKLYFKTPANFPSFCYAIFNPFGDETTKLAPNTLYKVFVDETFQLNGINVTTGFSQDFLTIAGY
jgi:hypothetical protein